MNQTLQSVITGVVTGVCASLLWAGFVLVSTWLKHWRISRAFRKTVHGRGGVVGDATHFGIPVENTTPWPVVVRTVRILFHDDWLDLEYEGSLQPHYLNHIEVRPKTVAFWAAPVEQAHGDITGAYVEIEYQSPLGRTTVTKLSLQQDHVARLQKNVRRQQASPPQPFEIVLDGEQSHAEATSKTAPSAASEAADA
ncbi:MAG: hypothetical protein JRJ62_13840 [Deltaproteobacteria bacterium]|nr:hypothetical protein [Deltaproteobacteria bacterium]